VAWPVGRYFALEPTAFAILVVQVATPVAVTSYLLAEKYCEESESVAGLVVASTLLTVGYLPILLGILMP
jgi:predicted permease